MTTTPPVSLSSVERTEIKWALRSRNALARYLNWLSLRVPWAWRIRLDLVVLGNLILALGVWIAVSQLPTEESGDFYVGDAVNYIYLAGALAALGVGFFWAFTVTKSVRARSAPKLGPEPRILTSIAVCASFGFWLLVGGAAPYFNMQRDLGTGQYGEARYVPPQPAQRASINQVAEEAPPVDQARIDELTEVLRANRRTGKLWETLWGRDVHDLWIGYRYSDRGPEAVPYVLQFIESTPRWRDDPELQRRMAASQRSVLAYPGLVAAFKESPEYRSALIHWYARNDSLLQGSQVYRDRLAEFRASLPQRMSRYRTNVSYGDDALYRYTRHLQAWMDNRYPDDAANLVQIDTRIRDYQAREQYLTDEEYNAYVAVTLDRRAILGNPDLNAAFLQHYQFSEFVTNEVRDEVTAGRHHDSIRAEPTFHSMATDIDEAGDPAATIPEHWVRQDLQDRSWVAMSTMVLIAVLLLAVFTTSMNRVGLGATLGSVCIAVVIGIAAAVTAGIVMNQPRPEGAPPESEYHMMFVWGVAAAIALLPPLIFPIRDAVTGVRRRWSRAMGLVSVWGSVAWFGILVGMIDSTPVLVDKLSAPNGLAESIMLGLLWVVAVAVFAKLIFALIGRISTYPQPG